MAEASKVRLVRCPKCENLLPELPDFSIYQCGGCGAVLRGKKKGILEDSLVEPSETLKDTRISGEGSVSNSSEAVMEASTGMERIRKERVVPDRTSTSRAESKELLDNAEMSRRGKQRVGRPETFDEEYMPYQRGALHYRNQGKISDSNVDRPEFANFNPVKETRMPPVESLRSRPVMDQWGPTSNGSQIPYGPARGRYDNLPYHDEGPSSYDMNPYYEHGGRTRYPSHNLNGIDSLENLENGRAELLRKLDELKDQLSKSCEVGDKPKEKPHQSVDPYGRHQSVYTQENLNRSHGLNRKPHSPDELEAHYISQAPGFIPYRDRYGTSMPEPYPQRGYPHEFAGYADRPDMHWRSPHDPPSHYMRGPYREHYPGYYEDVSHDHTMLHRHENLFHQPACSCVHCYNKHLHMAPKADSSVFHDRRSRNEPSHPDFHYSLNPSPHGPQSYSSGGSSVHPVHSRQSLLIHNLSDPDTERDGNSYHRPRKMGTPHKNGKILYPIAGGAPFVTCSSCFELLKLPRNHVSLAKSQQKMKCGACSSVIMFELGNTGYVVSASVRVEEVATEIDDGSSGTGDETVRYWHGDPNSADVNALPNEYEEFQPKLTSADNKPNSMEPGKQMDPLSRASSLSENEPNPLNLPSKEGGPPPAIVNSVLVKSFLLNDLSPKELPDHSSDSTIASRSENGSKSKRSEQERLSHKSSSRQSSLKDAAVATEMDMSLNEFSNSCVSQDSMEDHPRVNKGGDSFLAGLIKKSFKKPNQNVEAAAGEVFVNGHLLPDRVVKKAEKLAGPIQPGDYWYDSQAGFWGVMGYPCLGIVMPNIEEFNYRMPENCAAGNTQVFVNGRELHQKDLDLLSSRGLPITRHRSYTVEMSGKVVDDQTGEELEGLGKLAPTVEKAKHGFGMKVPRSIAQEM